MKVFSLLCAAMASAVLACALYAASDKVLPERSSADAQAPPSKPTLLSGTPAVQIAALITQHEKAMTAFRKQFEAAKTEVEQEKLEPLYPDPNPYAKLLVQIAEQNLRDPAAVEAFLWTVHNDSPGRDGAKTPFDRAKDFLVRDYLKNPKIGPLCLVLCRDSKDAGAVDIIRRVLEGNANKDAQAQAAFALAKLLRERAGWARTLQSVEPKVLARLEKDLGKNNLDALERGDAGALEKEADSLLKRITKDKDYADTTILYGESQIKLGVLADRELFQIRHLQPGKPAPEIVGEDTFAVRFRLPRPKPASNEPMKLIGPAVMAFRDLASLQPARRVPIAVSTVGRQGSLASTIDLTQLELLKLQNTGLACVD